MRNYQSIWLKVPNEDTERKAHIKYVSSIKDGIIVEIGVLNGETTQLFLDNSNSKVVGIDPIIPDSMNSSMIGSLFKIRKLEEKYTNFKFFKAYSYNVVKTWNESIDYLFIDGNHNYEAVKKDFEDWFPFIRSGGILAMHDSAANRGGPHWWPGPSKLADSLLEDNRVEYLETAITLTIFRKI